MSISVASITDNFREYLRELERIAELRRNLAHTPNTSNAPVLSALISEKVKSLKYFYDEGYYSRIDIDETYRIVELIVTFGKGYDDSGGLEYASFQGLDHILVGVIGLWTYHEPTNISGFLGAIRARLNEGPATSAAQELDKHILIALKSELKEAEAMNKGLLGDKFQPHQN